MRPIVVRTPERASRARPSSKFGYDQAWWGGKGRAGAADTSYWRSTTRPVVCLLFVLPLLAAYEIGVSRLAGGGDAAELWRTGADVWMRRLLQSMGVFERWLPPLIVVAPLVAWQAVDRRDWRFRPVVFAGMAIESLVLALVLIGLSKVVDIGFDRLDHGLLFEAGADSSRELAGRMIGFMGAGIYEEALFRLALIPILFGILRVLQTPALVASTLSLTGSALLFSIAHHAGNPGEAFTWYAFFFRWLAGVYFGWVFTARGFGIAVGTHVAYDLLVGGLGWHL